MKEKAPKPHFKYKKEKIYFDGISFESKLKRYNYIMNNYTQIMSRKNISAWFFFGGFMFLWIILNFLISVFLTLSLVFIINAYFDNRIKKAKIIIEEFKVETKKNEKKIEASQLKKGLIKFNGNWYTKKDYNKILIEDLKLKIKKSKFENQEMEYGSYLQGREMICLDCKYIWNIKKPKGKPAKCPSCNSKNIELNLLLENKEMINLWKEKIKLLENER